MAGNPNLKKAAKKRVAMYHGQTLAAVHAEMNDPANRAAAKKKAKKAHPGFQSVQANIAKKQGISQEKAGAILAHSTRNASHSAKKANPRLKRVH